MKKQETPKGDTTPELSHSEKALKQALWAAMQTAVNEQIGGDRKHGWVNDDSFAVIEAVVAEDAAQSKAETGKYTLSDPASKLIRLVINPSAYRQKEEAEGGRLDKADAGKRSGSLSSIEKEFNS